MIRILVVCRANVCRSPFAQILLEDALAGWADADPWVISSAGTRAHRGAKVCGLVAETVGARPAGQPRALEHRSRVLDGGLVGAADLILTAEAGQRGLASASAPRSQSRIFTLTEAAALTELIEPRGVGRHASPEVRFSSWVQSLDDARGLLPVRQVAAKRFGVARRPEPLWDIPDGHLQAGRAHRRALARVDAAVTAIAASIRATA